MQEKKNACSESGFTMELSYSRNMLNCSLYWTLQKVKWFLALKNEVLDVCLGSLRL